MLCALVGLLIAASPAMAAAPRSVRGGTAVWAGDSAYMRIALVGPANDCRLEAWTPGQVLTLSDITPTAKNITWVWQVPNNARTANWHLLASCGSSQITASLAVRGRTRRGVLSLAAHMHVVQSGTVLPTAELLTGTLITAVAQSWWQRNSTRILSAFHTGVSVGQCTDYVSSRRPDVIARVDLWAYSESVLAGGRPLNVDWTARYWARNAQNAGLSTGNRPRTNAVVAFQPGAYGAFSDGHVAIVDSVGRDGSFTISEMHAPTVGLLTTRHFSAATSGAMSVDPHVTFIYG
jgi:surface antigen